MMKVLSVFILVCLGCAFAVDSCVQIPTAHASGETCSDSLNCIPGLYCNNQSICTPWIKENMTCVNTPYYQDTCVPGTVCIGTVGAQQCIAYANPGQQCNFYGAYYDLTNSTTPQCAPQLYCYGNITISPLGVCRGGQVNDTCTQGSDCLSGFCTAAGYCLGLSSGSECVYYNDGASYNNAQCAPGLQCYNGGGSNGTCIPLSTSGGCTEDDQCAYGYVCDYTDALSQLNCPSCSQCLPIQSKSSGQFCGTHAELCTGSTRCVNGYCAKNTGNLCSPSSGCSLTQTCACNGKLLDAGLGTCVGTCVQSSIDALNKCLLANCQTTLASATGGGGLLSSDLAYYSGSCAQRLCKSELNSFAACNSGSTLSASIVAIFFAAFFLISKKF